MSLIPGQRVSGAAFRTTGSEVAHRRERLSKRERDVLADMVIMKLQLEGLTQAIGYAMKRLDELNFKREYYSRVSNNSGQQLALGRLQALAFVAVERIIESTLDEWERSRNGQDNSRR